MYKGINNILAEEAGRELQIFRSSENEEMNDIIYSLVHEKSMFEDECINYMRYADDNRY